MSARTPIRVLLCKPGLDGHDRGMKIVARALRDAGMEVIYGGVRQTIPQITAVALQEDVDVIGVSNHSGALPDLCAGLAESLREAGIDGIPVVAGGTLVDTDEPALRQLGIAAVFGPGSSTKDIVERIEALVQERRAHV